MKGAVVNTMPTIRIDDDVMNYLQSKAKAFVDSPNDVLRRELGIDRGSAASRSRRFAVRARRGFRPDKDYSHHPLRGFHFQSQFHACNSFKDLLIKFCGELRKKHQEKFDNLALTFHGRKRVYFSLDPKGQRLPGQLPGTGIYAETNLSANRIVGISQKLAAGLGHAPDDFLVE